MNIFFMYKLDKTLLDEGFVKQQKKKEQNERALRVSVIKTSKEVAIAK